MADKEISGLTAATTPLAGTELVHIDQGGNSRKVALTDVVAISTGAMLKADYDPNADGVIAVAQGGTGGATASAARTNLGLGTMAVQNAATVAITGGSITGITDLAVADGGTGSSTASGARTNLGLVIGTDVQAYSANLAGFAATTVANVQNRVNHTGTQLAATISDFSTAADARVSAAIGSTVQAYSALLDSVSDLSLAAGDIVYATGAAAVSRLPLGAEGQVLAVSGGAPAWGTELVVGGLLASNNLSDVANATTARTNIGAQASSANLTAWSALATSAKQDASANLTTLAAVTPGSKGLAILADTSSDAVLTELGGGSKGKAIFADTNSDAIHNEMARDWSGENLFTYSQELDNAVWGQTQLTVTADATTAPDGTLTADKLVENTATNSHYIFQSTTLTSGTTYALSVFAKAAERSVIQLISFNSAVGIAAFDLAAGTVINADAEALTPEIAALGDGWYRCSITFVSGITGAASNGFGLSNGSPATGAFDSYTGDGASGLYVWGAQIEAKAYPTNYTKTTSSAHAALSGVPTLSVPNVMQRRYVDVGAYASLTDTNDAHAAIQAAFDDANGREIVFTNPYGGTRYYRSLTRPSGAGLTTGVLLMPKKARIIMEPGALLDFSDWANTGNTKYLLYANGVGALGSEPSSVDLNSNASDGDTTIPLVAGGGASFTGGWHIIVSDALFTSEDGSLGTKGEWIYVKDVSTDTLNIAGKLRDNYATADNARVFPMTGLLCELVLENMNLLGCGAFSGGVVGDRGIGIDTGINCQILGGSVSRSDQLTVTFANVLNGLIDGTRVDFDSHDGSLNKYGPHLANICERVTVRNCEVIGGKEAMGLTATGGIQGPTRDCTFAFNRMRGAGRGGFTTHDNHEGIVFTGNIIEDCELGVDNRIVGGTYTNNVFRRLGFNGGSISSALYLGSGAGKVLFQGNTVESALRGVYMANAITHEATPGDIDIIDNDMRQMGSYGVLIENTNASTAACGTVTVAGNRFEGDSSTAMRGVEIEGKWKPIVVNNICRNGNAGRAVYLHATANGTGTNGPVNPVVTGNRWDSTFTEPLIQHSSGRNVVEDNSQLDATALPSVASASAISIPTSGEIFDVTGTTTINTIANAAAYVGKRITMVFAASLTVTHNSGGAAAANTIHLAGAANFSATAGDTLTLVAVYNSGSSTAIWREASRAVI